MGKLATHAVIGLLWLLHWLPLRWLQGDALASGLPDHSFDGAAMAYGLRNLAELPTLRDLRGLESDDPESSPVNVLPFQDHR